MKDAHKLSDEEIAGLSEEEAKEAWQDLTNWHGFGYSEPRTAAALLDNPALHKEVLRARYAVQKRLGRHTWQRPLARSGVPRSIHLRHIRKAMSRGEIIPEEVLEEYRGEI